MTRLRLAGVSYRIGASTIVDDLALDVADGELLGVIGPNGAGKSTLLGLASGELQPNDGRVEIDGASIGSLSRAELATTRALLPQHPTLRFAFRCEEVVRMGRYPYDEPASTTSKAVAAAMEATETTHLAERVYPTLSGGEQARVALARVLAQGTPLVLLDEPTASLDLRHQHTVMTRLRQLADAGSTVVAVLHDIDLAARYADRIALLDRGELAALGAPRDVLVPEILARAYGIAVQVVEHPTEAYPMVVAGTAGSEGS